MRRKVFLAISTLILALRERRILPQELEHALFCLRDSKRIVFRILSQLPQPSQHQLKAAIRRAIRERRLLVNADSGALLNQLVIAHTDDKIEGIEQIHRDLNSHTEMIATKARGSHAKVDIVTCTERMPPWRHAA
ncbi:MAG: hypothetical protein Q7R83_03765 [bacterium]|nr:hypothetical protein [bacterium]